MPTHYVYVDPDKTTLFQGDILRKTNELVAHLEVYHPYYANHTDYKYFIVLTQSCDLYRRNGKSPNSRYITLASVRPVEEVLRREAAKEQLAWQVEERVIGAKTKEKLVLFLESLFDNNKDGYFYVHSDLGLGIEYNCCAFLPLSVALKIDHYDMCLSAKIAQLQEPFQAKLGHLLGDMCSRVATTEWNEHYPDRKVADEAVALLNKTFVTYGDDKIKAGLADLAADGSITTKSAAEISSYILKKKIVPRKTNFQGRAIDVLDTTNLIDLIRARAEGPLKSNLELQQTIDELLKEAGVDESKLEEVRKKVTYAFLDKLRLILTDATLPGKREVLAKVLTKLLADSVITSIMQ